MTANFRERLLQGRRAMAHLIHVWHELNGWSHKVLPALVECLELGRVHNSQISNLRNGKLSSPGPEVFLALSQANSLLHSGIEPFRDRLLEMHPELFKVLSESSVPLLRPDGEPLGAGELFEIFIGLSPLPPGFDWLIEEEEAAGLSEAISDFFCNGKPWRQCRDRIMAAYPAKKNQRRERFAAVMAGLRDYRAEELDGELFNLFATYKAINTKSFNSIEDFLIALREHSISLKD